MNFLEGDALPVDLLATTETIYRDAAIELARAVKAARTDAAGETKAVIQAVRDMKSAFQSVMDERTRVEKLRNQTAGVIGESILDLDAARDEIGRRLARLRDAGDGE